jgi:hypothetical protein
MSIYNDMANDAGYKYGTPENEQMAQMIEEEHKRDMAQAEAEMNAQAQQEAEAEAEAQWQAYQNAQAEAEYMQGGYDGGGE